MVIFANSSRDDFEHHSSVKSIPSFVEAKPTITKPYKSVFENGTMSSDYFFELIL